MDGSASSYIVVLITAQDVAEAEKISQSLLEQKLIACANILPAVKSLFWWEGRIDSSGEVLMLLKTKKDFFPAVVKAVKALHGYSVPEIIALPIVEGSEDYLNWIQESTKGRT